MSKLMYWLGSYLSKPTLNPKTLPSDAKTFS